MGPMRTSSYRGRQYSVITTVAQQLYVGIKLLMNKEHLESYFPDYIRWIG